MAKKKVKEEKEEGILRFIFDVIVNSVVIIALFFFVQTFVAAPFQVIGNSMIETLNHGEYILVSKLEYTFGSPHRGDVIVFHPPEHVNDYYIKRIVGIPGDEVLLKAGEVHVNGEKITENYLEEGLKTCLIAHMQSCVNDNKTYTVPDDKYFVLGDNRKGSSDSRAWFDDDNKPNPFVSTEQIQGKTRVVLYPLPELRLVPMTNVFDAVSQGTANDEPVMEESDPATKEL